MRVQTRLALEEQLMDQFKRKQQEEQDDKQFREQQTELLAERDKLDIMSNERRKRIMSEHRKAIRQMLEERKLQRAHLLALEMKMRDAEEEQEKRK